MSERLKQISFLKSLLHRDDSALRRNLHARIAQAEQNEKCVRSAMRLVGVFAMLCFCGLCYEAIFIPEFFDNPTLFLTRMLGYLTLGSTLGWIVFSGYWLWYRALTNRVYEECRRMLKSVPDLHVVLSPPNCPNAEQDSVSNHDTVAVPSSVA